VTVIMDLWWSENWQEETEGESRSIWRKACFSVTLSATYPTWTALGSKL